MVRLIIFCTSNRLKMLKNTDYYVDVTVIRHNLLTAFSGVTDRGTRWRAAPPGKLNVETGPPLVDILIFSFV